MEIHLSARISQEMVCVCDVGAVCVEFFFEDQGIRIVSGDGGGVASWMGSWISSRARGGDTFYLLAMVL